MSSGVITTEILRITNLARSYTLGPLDPRFNLHRSLEEVLRNHLPDDAHERASGRLFISLTRVRDKTNVVLSEFRYREQLIKALLAGCFIPTYSGLVPPPFKGVRYIDGSVTDNQPVIDHTTVRVSPFSGEADICPRTVEGGASHASLVNMMVDVTGENLSRLFRVFVPQDPAAMIRLCQQGYDDALGYLQENRSVLGMKSFFITSTFLLLEQEKGTETQSIETTAETQETAGLLVNSAKFRLGSPEQQHQWIEEKAEASGDSLGLVSHESVLRKLSLSRSGGYRQIRPVDLIRANLKRLVYSGQDHP